MALRCVCVCMCGESGACSGAVEMLWRAAHAGGQGAGRGRALLLCFSLPFAIPLFSPPLSLTLHPRILTHLVHEHLRLVEEALQGAERAVLHLDIANDDIEAVLLHLERPLQRDAFLCGAVGETAMRRVGRCGGGVRGRRRKRRGAGGGGRDTPSSPLSQA